MTRLVLLRHGIAADPGAFDGDDDQRPLTPTGRKRTREAVRGLRRMGVRPKIIYSSPLVRALETAEIAARGLRCSETSIQTSEALRPDAEPAELLRLLGRGENEILCTGHAPNLDRIIGALFSHRQAFTSLKKSGAARIDFDNGSGTSGAEMESEPSLVWLLGPRALRRLAR
jgi:phosphohistidine phosphatase